MSMNRWLSWSAGLLSLWLVDGVSLAQDEAIVNRLYGRGVHAYFSGDLARAERELTEAIHLGSRDPRAYYFRGLTYLRMGRTFEAEADMQVGGQLETEQLHRVGMVNRALERIQGRDRMLLEKSRRQARSAAYNQQQSERKLRYEVLRRREEDVLRRRLDVPLEGFAPRLPPNELSPEAVGPPRQVAPTPADEQPDSAKPASPAETAAPADAALPPRRIVPPTVRPAVPADSAPPGVRSVPPEQKVKAGSLGRILSRILGRALPESASPAGESAPEEMDPFSEATEAPAPVEPRPAEQDVFGTDLPEASPREAPAAVPPSSEAQPTESPSSDDAGAAGDQPAEPAEPSESDPFAVE
jgi:hypothetical protein